MTDQQIQKVKVKRLSHVGLWETDLAALAARLKPPGVELSLEPRDAAPDLGDTLWFNDPDNNRIEISVTPDTLLTRAPSSHRGRRAILQPHAIQHVALNTTHLEAMVEF